MFFKKTGNFIVSGFNMGVSKFNSNKKTGMAGVEPVREASKAPVLPLHYIPFFKL